MNQTEQTSRVVVLLFTDIVDSVDMQQRLGTQTYTEILQQHDDLFREALDPIAESVHYQDTGDGQLAQFKTAADGVNAALRFQRLLDLAEWPHEKPSVRVGLHQGQITEIKSSDSAPGKAVGMPINLAARIMGLAQGGQILLTRSIFDDARQFVRDHPRIEGDAEPPGIEWKAHGKYLFKGADEAMEVFEVGATGHAPMVAPPDSEKAQRSISLEEEETLGWRPGVGLEIPHRKNWVLEKSLGAGGFGEVWLAIRRKTKARRVFKFCFDAERLRSFKRELTLFRLLRESLGDRPDITAIHEIHLESSPYFLELDYVEGGDLEHWAESKGGIGTIPLADRIEMVAQVAETAAAAHSVGIIHKDIKPSNILIDESGDGKIQPQLMDFGIGYLSDSAKLNQYDITKAGFTQTLVAGNDSSRTGTFMYAPPEVLVGKPHTIQGDVYSLGVFLYQMASGNLSDPLATGWRRKIDDELLAADIAACVEGDPERRLGSAAELVQRLRSLDQRAAELEAQRVAEKKAIARRRLRRLGAAAALILLGFATLLGIGYLREKGLRSTAEQAQQQETQQRERAETELAKSEAVTKFVEEMLGSVAPEIAGKMDRRLLEEILGYGATKIGTELDGQPEVQARLHSTIGIAYMAIGRYGQSAPHLQSAWELNRQLFGDDAPETVRTMVPLANLYRSVGSPQAEGLISEALTKAQRTFGAENPHTLSLENILGCIYLDQRRYAESKPHLEAALDGRVRILGSDHHDTVESINNLALLHLANREFVQAEKMLKQVLDAIASTAGDGHARTLPPMSNLGVFYMTRAATEKRTDAEGARDTLAKAAPLLSRCLDLSRATYGPTHPETFASMNNLASLYRAQGETESAIDLYRQALDAQARALGRDHRDTIITMENLIHLHRELGQAREAAAVHAEIIGDIHALPAGMRFLCHPADQGWRFLEAGKQAAAGWRTADFDDSGWQAGSGHFGYGDGDEDVELPFGTDPGAKPTTYYFRTTFELGEPVADALLNLIRDDGAIVYLNGQEVLRSNLPDGEIDATTPASATVNEYESFVVRQSIDPNLFVAGTNVIAAEVHQSSPESSDLSFQLAITVAD